MIRSTTAAMLLIATLLGACSDPVSPKDRPRAEGREETRSIRNTEAVGYSGNAIADKLDASLDASEQRKAELDRRAAEAAGD